MSHSLEHSSDKSLPGSSLRAKTLTESKDQDTSRESWTVNFLSIVNGFIEQKYKPTNTEWIQLIVNPAREQTSLTYQEIFDHFEKAELTALQKREAFMLAALLTHFEEIIDGKAIFDELGFNFEKKLKMYSPFNYYVKDALTRVRKKLQQSPFEISNFQNGQYRLILKREKPRL